MIAHTLSVVAISFHSQEDNFHKIPSDRFACQHTHNDNFHKISTHRFACHHTHNNNFHKIYTNRFACHHTHNDNFHKISTNRFARHHSSPRWLCSCLSGSDANRILKNNDMTTVMMVLVTSKVFRGFNNDVLFR